MERKSCSYSCGYKNHTFPAVNVLSLCGSVSVRTALRLWGSSYFVFQTHLPLYLCYAQLGRGGEGLGALQLLLATENRRGTSFKSRTRVSPVQEFLVNRQHVVLIRDCCSSSQNRNISRTWGSSIHSAAVVMALVEVPATELSWRVKEVGVGGLDVTFALPEPLTGGNPATVSSRSSPSGTLPTAPRASPLSTTSHTCQKTS